MADEQAVATILVSEDGNNQVIVADESNEVLEGESMNEDILQKALAAATEAFNEAQEGEYTDQQMSVVSEQDGVEDGSQQADMSGDVQYTVVDNGTTENTIPEEQQVTELTQGEPLATLVMSNTPAPTAAPLGTSENPIRIIQQGNQYTSMQQLSPEQLQQIMTVLQNQHVAKETTASTGGSSVLYNPSTNTRIVYRVMYPSDLHKTDPNRGSTIKSILTGKRPGRPPKRKFEEEYEEEDDLPITDDEDDIAEPQPELSKEEKEARKRLRPRTRSGRISKPPKHMMKDYKHIHPVDWDEDYDDSDGGYSDYRGSGDEEARNKDDDGKEYTAKSTVTPTLKPKSNKCETCDKAYIGIGGLRRHYMNFPDHGHIEGDDELTNTPVNGIGITPATPAPPVAHRGRGRPSLENKPERRKNKLAECIRMCTNEEVMEVVLPQLSQQVTPYEFLMMKVETAGGGFQEIYSEFEALHKQVVTACSERLQAVSTDQADTSTLQISDAVVAKSLGLKDDTKYHVIQPAPEEAVVNNPPFQYKLLTANPDIKETGTRQVQVVVPGELVHPSRKVIVSRSTDPAASLPISTNTSGVAQGISLLGTPRPGVQTISTDNIITVGNIVQESANTHDTVEILNGGPEQSENIHTTTIQNLQNLIQTSEGIIIIQNPDGSTVQLQHDESIPLETVQALLAMEQEGGEVKFVTSTYAGDATMEEMVHEHNDLVHGNNDS